MATVISKASLKGGTGKTTGMVNTAHTLMRMGNKVLVVDADPQGNASMTLGLVSPFDQPRTTTDIFLDGATFSEVVQPSKYEGIDLVPSNLGVVAALKSLPANSIRSIFGFQQALTEETKAEYDYILIDCPPSIEGAPLVNAMVISDYIVLTVDGTYALAGTPPLLEAIATIRKDARLSLHVLGILLTQQDGRTNDFKILKAATQAAFRKEYGDRFVFDQHIPGNATIRDAQRAGKAVCDFKAKCSGCEAYTAFTHEMLKRIADIESK